MLAIAHRLPAEEIVAAVRAARQHFEQHDRFVEMIEIVGGEPGRWIDIGLGKPGCDLRGGILGLRRVGAILIFHCGRRPPFGPAAVLLRPVKAQLSADDEEGLKCAAAIR